MRGEPMMMVIDGGSPMAVSLLQGGASLLPPRKNIIITGLCTLPEDSGRDMS